VICPLQIIITTFQYVFQLISNPERLNPEGTGIIDATHCEMISTIRPTKCSEPNENVPGSKHLNVASLRVCPGPARDTPTSREAFGFERPAPLATKLSALSITHRPIPYIPSDTFRNISVQQGTSSKCELTMHDEHIGAYVDKQQ
jgi:hypothetical protein